VVVQVAIHTDVDGEAMKEYLQGLDMATSYNLRLHVQTQKNIGLGLVSMYSGNAKFV